MLQDSKRWLSLTPGVNRIEVLSERRLPEPGTLLLSGTIEMHEGVVLRRRRRAELSDPVLVGTLTLAYGVERLPEPIC